MAERTIPIPQPLFERQEQSFEQGDDDLTQFLNDQRRMRFTARDRLTYLIPHISRRVQTGDFKQLENLDHIRESEQIVNDRYQMYDQAVLANGTLNLHLDQLKPNSPPEQKYVNKKDASLEAIEERKFIKPFTEEQKASYYRIKEISQQVREGTYKQPEEKKASDEIVQEKVVLLIDDREDIPVDQVGLYIEGNQVDLNPDEYNLFYELAINPDQDFNLSFETIDRLRTVALNKPTMLPETVLDALFAMVDKIEETTKRQDIFEIPEDESTITLSTKNAEIRFKDDEKEEEDLSQTQAKRAPTLMFSEGIRINDVQREDFNMGDIRLLQAVANKDSYMPSRILSEVTGIPQREVKAHITALARTLSRILQQPISVESTTKGFRLAGVTFDIQTPPTTSEGEEERTDKPERQEIEVDFADRQISAMLGALEYRILTQNKDNLVEAMGQTQYESLTESCRQLSLLVRASNPTTVEFAAAARRQGISLQEYQQIRSQLLNSIRGLRTAENRDELLATLSLDHQQVLNWLVNQPDIEFTQIVEEASSLGEAPLKSEQDLYANSWSTETVSSANGNTKQNAEIISPTRMKALQPAILEAIQTAQIKVPEGQPLTQDNLNRLFKPMGKATGYINKATIDFSTKNGIIAQEGSITPEDVIILTFIYEVTAGKTFRRGFRNNIAELRRACNEIREEVRKQLNTQEPEN